MTSVNPSERAVGQTEALRPREGDLMVKTNPAFGLSAAIGLALAFGGDALAQDTAAGKAVAQRYCATCHNIASGESPLPDAPPFATLKDRYRAGGLAQLLEKGMIENHPYPLEEGRRRIHPRMPAFPLGEDEVVALADYLRTFEAAETPAPAK